MTALHQYSRLEAQGLWRSDPGAQRREVIVGLRHATIVLLDPKSETPLSQWSLPAIIRLAETDSAVIFTPHEGGIETLEIDDLDMIAALDTIRTVLDRRRKKTGRLRYVLSAGAGAVLIAAMIAWVPLRFYEFTSQRLPAAALRDVAALSLRDIGTIAGSPCADPRGVAAAQDLATRLLPDAPPRIMVLRTGLTFPATLADGTILLPQALIAGADGPDTLAGIILEQHLRASQSPPLEGALRHAGLWATAQLFSRGALPEGAMDGYGLALVAAAKVIAPLGSPSDVAALHAAFAQARVTSAPYAAYSGNAALAAMADAAPQGSDPIVLEDAAFLGLQYICDG